MIPVDGALHPLTTCDRIQLTAAESGAKAQITENHSMPKKPEPHLPTASVQPPIHTIRGQKEIVDLNLASLYGVETKMLNRVARRKPERFRLQLSQEEAQSLKSSNLAPQRAGAAEDAICPTLSRNMSYSRLAAAPGLIFHSDCGSEYASRYYADLLAGHGIDNSMSRKSNCWENYCSETLFGSLKVARLRGMEFTNKPQGGEGRDGPHGCSRTTDRGYTRPCAISAQLSSSNKRSLHHSPSQHDREGSTATRRKSKPVRL